MCRLVQTYDADVRDAWEERFEAHHGFWRHAAERAMGACLDRGVLDRRLARVRCGECPAELIRRVYEVDPLACPRCGGRMRIVALTTESQLIERVLRHLVTKPVEAQSPPGHDNPVT